MSDNLPNQSSKFRTKIRLKWMMAHVERIRVISKLDLKLKILKSILFDYSDAYVIVKGTILVGNTTDTEVIFKSLVPLTDLRN